MAAGDAQRADLSGRERQVAQAYAAGASHRQIADRLFIAPATVRTHLSTIYRKLGVSTKIELLRALEGERRRRRTPARSARVPAAVASKRQVTVLHALLDVGIAAQADPEAAAALGGSVPCRGCGGGGASPRAAAQRGDRGDRRVLRHPGLRRDRPGAGGAMRARDRGRTSSRWRSAPASRPVRWSRPATRTDRLWGGTPILAAALAREAGEAWHRGLRPDPRRAREPVRVRGARTGGVRRRRGRGPLFLGRRRVRGRYPVRGAARIAADADRRPRASGRAAAGPVRQRALRTGAGGADLRRAGDRQVPDGQGALRPARAAARADAGVSMLAARADEPAASGGADRAPAGRRRAGTRRRRRVSTRCWRCSAT